MTPKEIARAIEELILGANDDYLAVISQLEDQLYRELSSTLHGLELDSQGYIKQTSDNRKIISKAEADFNNVIKSHAYQQALQNYINVIPKIDELNAKYFSEMTTRFAQNRIFIKDLRAQAIETLEKLILQEGLDVNIRLQIMDIVSQGVNTGASYNGMIKQVRDFVKGDENGGRLLAYVKTLTRDALFNYSRAYQQSVVKDIKVDFYFFAGGLQHSSRSFCIDRSDKFFHQKEVELWALEEWPGKRKGTTAASIFIYAGGYNCTHSIVPVDISVVPEFVIERAIKEGLYKKAA